MANGHRSGDSAADYCTTFWRHDIYSAGSQENAAWETLFRQNASEVGRDISWNGYEHNHLFVNLAGKGFVNAGFLLGVALEADSRQVAVDDFDADGLPDLLVGWSDRGSTPPRLMLSVFRNATPRRGNHWIGARLTEATAAQRLGARIVVSTDRGRQVAVYVASDSFATQPSPRKSSGLEKQIRCERWK